MSKNVLKTLMLPALIIFIMSSCSSVPFLDSNKPKNRVKKRNTTYTGVSKKRTSSTRARTTTVSYGTASSKRNNLINTAKQYMGKPYVYGGKKPTSGFDCSGFTSYVFEQNGISLKGASHTQAKLGKRKRKNALEVGDLIFFGSSNKVSHVGIVASVENNELKVIHSTSSRGVVIDDINSSDYWQKRYLFGRDVLD